MRYRREDENGDYSFGRGDATFLTDTPEAVAQAVKTRLALWRGQWFLDTEEGTPWKQDVLGKQYTDAYYMAVKQRILATPGVQAISEFSVTRDTDSRKMHFTATLRTRFGNTSITG